MILPAISQRCSIRPRAPDELVGLRRAGSLQRRCRTGGVQRRTLRRRRELQRRRLPARTLNEHDYFRGRLREVRLYGRALNDREVQRLFRAPR